MWSSIWISLVEVLAAGFLAYVWVILILRLYGKRTLAKLNAFNFIVTVALGSLLATVMLNRNVTILQGAAAFALLATLQWLVATLTIRMDWAINAVRSSPHLLLHRGRMLEEAMKAERIAPPTCAPPPILRVMAASTICSPLCWKLTGHSAC